MDKDISLLSDLLKRKDRFTYDLRSQCQVYEGIVCAYRATPELEHFSELTFVIAHAKAYDGIVGAWRDPLTREVRYDSCRIFTDLGNAMRFARAQRQRSVYDLYRNSEVWLTEQANASMRP